MNNRRHTRRLSIAKQYKTVRGVIKKTRYYLGSSIPYQLSSSFVTSGESSHDMMPTDPSLREVLRLSADIRITDDVLDEKLAKMVPRPLSRIKKVITTFRRRDHRYTLIAELFASEIKIQHSQLSKTQRRRLITRLIEIRPTDFFLLSQVILEQYPSRLTKSDLRLAKNFFYDFQRLRDLFDDIMTVEEDALKGSYNSLLCAKQAGIPPSFFEHIIVKKFMLLEKNARAIKRHPYHRLLNQTIRFWREQYRILFRPLLRTYYQDMEAFRKIYFMFKQV